MGDLHHHTDPHQGNIGAMNCLVRDPCSLSAFVLGFLLQILQPPICKVAICI